jgi:hypothetical protein
MMRLPGNARAQFARKPPDALAGILTAVRRGSTYRASFLRSNSNSRRRAALGFG